MTPLRVASSRAGMNPVMRLGKAFQAKGTVSANALGWQPAGCDNNAEDRGYQRFLQGRGSLKEDCLGMHPPLTHTHTSSLHNRNRIQDLLYAKQAVYP